MRKLTIAILALLATAVCASAQDIRQTVPEGYEIADSIVFVPISSVDTTIRGNIFAIMPDDVAVHQESAIRDAVNAKTDKNSSKMQHGFRVRIYFDNRRDARGRSSAIYSSFQSRYPGIPAYRDFDAPFFKVTVGDFRTKADALAFLEMIKGEYPSAFLVREDFKYPSLDSATDFVMDTVKVLRKK